MIIDAHQHFWRIGKHDCSWPTAKLNAIHRDFVAEDWLHVAAPLGVQASVLVQSQESDRDTDWLLELASRHDFIAAVLGWVDLAQPSATQRIAVLAQHPKLRALRPMLQSQRDDDWLLRAPIAPAIAAMLEHKLCFDALVLPRHLPHLLRFAERYPSLPIVIDHAAKPDIAHGVLDPWRADMRALAALSNVYCKLSGLVTEAAANWREDDLRPYVDHLLDTFGPARLIWGSDWPVLNLASNYSSWFRTADSLTQLQGAERAALFGNNAAQFYKLDVKSLPLLSPQSRLR